MHKVIFIDRDGVINKKAAPHCYIQCWEEFEFLPGVSGAIRKANEAGYVVLVVTNQRGVARGLMTMEDVNDIHRKMAAKLALEQAHIDNVYVCPHEKGQCSCRKPDIGLFLQAESTYPVDKENSWMIGDSKSDILAGQSYGIRTLQSENIQAAIDEILAIKEGV